MRFESVNESSIFFSYDYDEDTKIKNGNQFYVFLVKTEVLTFVRQYMSKKHDLVKMLIADTSLGPGTSKYWEENWHDKFVKEIKALTYFDEYDISCSLNIVFGY